MRQVTERNFEIIYESVSYAALWTIIETTLPRLINEVTHLLAEYDTDSD